MLTLRHLIILAALLIAVPSVAHAQAVWGNQAYSHPLCSNPMCEMCWGPNGIAAQLRAQQSAVVPTQTVVSESVEYETVQVPVVTKVKRCNGISCWWEDVTTYRTERRPIRNALKAARNLVDKATPRIDMLRVTELVPTPQEAVVAMLAIARPKPSEVLYDLGCGDGRVLVEATWSYGCRSVGIELNQESFKAAADRVDSFGFADKIRLYQGDVLNYTYEHADVVTLYLYPELMLRVLPRLRPGTRVISYIHPIDGGTKIVVRGYTFYTWTVPPVSL